VVKKLNKKKWTLNLKAMLKKVQRIWLMSTHKKMKVMRNQARTTQTINPPKATTKMNLAKSLLKNKKKKVRHIIQHKIKKMKKCKNQKCHI